MSVILVATALIAACVADAMPPGGLLLLTGCCLIPALLVDILVLAGPRNRAEGAPDPLARRHDDRSE